MHRLICRVAGWLVAFGVLILRMTCRIRIHGDPRRAIAADGHNHVFATLHAHQLAGSMAADRGTAAMVSRSADGGIVVPALLISGHVPIRGSSGNGKGGATALQRIIEHVRGGGPAMLACDGPRGPRGSVQKGIGLLASKSDSAALPVIAIPTRRWILTKTWDRLQIPKPFSTIDIYFGEPLVFGPDESLEQFVKRIEVELNQLETDCDPEEGTPVQRQAAAREARRAA